MTRRHDIDALRALAFALVMLYHVGMYYVAGWDWHLKSPYATQALQWPMRMVNLWRLDLVFLVSGVALALAVRGRPDGAVWRSRSWRLLLPLAFGMAVVVPYQPYAQGVANGLVEPGFGRFLLRYFTGGPWPPGAFDGWREGVTWNHLWYLAYLWVYTTALVLLMPLLGSRVGQRLQHAFIGLRGARLLLLPAAPLMLYSLTLWPRFAPTHDLLHDGWLHAVYFTVFVYGYWIGQAPGFWAEVRRLRWGALALAVGLGGLLTGWRWAAAVIGWPSPVPGSGASLALRCVADAYLWAVMVAVLGWAYHRLNRPWPWLAWANESVYPWYLLHQTLIIVLAVGLAPWALGPVLEPMLLLMGTALGCWGITAVVRRSRWLRPLFGLAT